MSVPVHRREYPELPLWRSMERRWAEIALYFDPWAPEEALKTSIRSELVSTLGLSWVLLLLTGFVQAILRAVIGRLRLLTGEMPPHSDMISGVQRACDGDDKREFLALPAIATRVLHPAEGDTPPEDTSRFPRWWLDQPKDWFASSHIIDRQGGGRPFELSQWIVQAVTDQMRRQTIANVTRVSSRTRLALTLYNSTDCSSTGLRRRALSNLAPSEPAEGEYVGDESWYRGPVQRGRGETRSDSS